MSQFSKDPKKIKAQIKRYERALQKEVRTLGFIDDSYGKRYLLGPLYMLLGDTAGALKSFAWFAETLPDDMGMPDQYLCWTLALYRAGQLEAAAHKLGQTMLTNLYLIPHLLGRAQTEHDMWHGSNIDRLDYVQYIAPEILALWDEPARQWAQETYDSPALRQVRERYIDIHRQLQHERPGPKRSQLVWEASALMYGAEANTFLNSL